MNFSKNPFIGANKVSTTKSITNINNFSRTSVEDIKQEMNKNNMNLNKQNRDIVRQKDEELKRQHEAFADKQRMFNTKNASNHANAINAQNNIRRGFNNGN